MWIVYTQTGSVITNILQLFVCFTHIFINCWKKRLLFRSGLYVITWQALYIAACYIHVIRCVFLDANMFRQFRLWWHNLIWCMANNFTWLFVTNFSAFLWVSKYILQLSDRKKKMTLISIILIFFCVRCSNLMVIYIPTLLVLHLFGAKLKNNS